MEGGLTKQYVMYWGIKNGYELDRYGHLQKEKNGDMYRIKLQPTSVRFEKKINVEGKKEWMRLGSSYYKDLYIGDNGKLSAKRVM